MERSLFWRIQYAFFVVLWEKKLLSEEEFLHFTAPLREKMRTQTDDIE